jgi:DNA-binding NtrC family response regulator
MEHQPTSSNASPCVAILNTSQEMIELLQDVVEEEGLTTATAYIVDFRRGQRDLTQFFQDHRPRAVLYDIAIPYVENWRFFQEQVLAPGFLPERCFIITTTNKTVLEALVGPTHAIELIGRPFDLDTIVQAVRRALQHGCVVQ